MADVKRLDAGGDILISGRKRIVSGPSYEAVQARLDELIRDGAQLLDAPEESYGACVGVCDTGGRK